MSIFNSDGSDWIKKVLENTDIDALSGILRGLSDTDKDNGQAEQLYSQGLLPMPQKENLNIPPEPTSSGLLGDITTPPPAQVPEPPQQLETPTPIQPKYDQEPDAKTTIDKETLNAARNGNPPTAQILNNNALPTNNPLQIDKSGAPPNPVYNELVNTLAYAKLLYETAQQGEKGDAQREIATRTAQMVRQQAEALGIDISQFGADNANAADMYNNAYTQRLQDIANLYKGGKFHETADEFYRRKYLSHMGNKSDDVKDIISSIFGVGSSDTAKMLAQEEAKQYQANRVAYLDGMLNAYGLDGNKGLNRFGHEIAGMLMKEDPDLVNMYLQRYPNADTRDMVLEDKAIEAQGKREEKYINQAYKLQEMQIRNAFEMAQLQYGGNIDLIKSFVAHQFNLSQTQVNALYQDWLNAKQNARSMARDKEQSYLRSEEDIAKIKAEFAGKKDWAVWAKENGFDKDGSQLSDNNMQRIYDEGLELARLQGYGNEDAVQIARNYLRAYVENQLYGKDKGTSSGSSSGNGTNKTVEYWNTYYGKLIDQYEALMKPYSDNVSGKDLPESVAQKRDSLISEMDKVRKAIQIATGMETPEKTIPQFTGDEEVDAEALKLLWDESHHIGSEYKKKVRDWLVKSGVTERTIESYMAQVDAGLRKAHNN